MHAVQATFYDGVTASRRRVTVGLGADALEIAEGDAVVARWPYDTLRRLQAPDGVLRIQSLGSPELARLESSDAGFEAELHGRCPRLDEVRHYNPRTVGRIVGWSLAAAASLVATVVFLVPVAADLLAPLVPVSAERRLGDAVDNQLRGMFSAKSCTSPDGVAALAKLSDKLVSQAQPHLPVQITVLASKVPNAVALPGGRAYLFDGLLQRAENPDEVAGVLAHELGHVVHRDTLRALIQAGGSSFLIGLLFGDVSGSGALVLAARAVIDRAYSREAETAADTFAGDVMLGLGRSPKPMGVFLFRVTGSQRGERFPFLNSHPVTDDRLAALSARDAAPRGAPLLTEAEWRAFKAICSVTE